MNKWLLSLLNVIFFSAVLNLSSLAHSALTDDGLGVVSISKKGEKIELAVVTHSIIPPGAMRPTISIGKQRSNLSKPSNDGNAKKIIFLMSSKQFEETIDGSAVTIRYGLKVWNCGIINKKLLK